MPSVPAPRTLGRYHLVAMLGQGGMAKVFLSIVPGPAGVQKLLVVKELRPELAHDADVHAMFLDEARLAARLNHPNVVQTYEVGEEAGHYFLAMEYLEGQPLNRIKRRLGEKLPLNAHLRILVDVLAGLHYAHELTDYDGSPLAVVHRDVSPHNVFVTYDGQVKLVDFGIAKAAGAEGATKNGMFKGKVTYASPEQALGLAIDRRADLFAVGVMLWEALTGERMWGNKGEVQVLLAITSGGYRRPREVRPDVPPELDALCMRALARDPDERFATAAEMQHALDAFLEREEARYTTRQVGQWIAEAFEEERSAIRATVDTQIKRVAQGAAGEPPVLPTMTERTPPFTPSVGGHQVTASQRLAEPAARTFGAWRVVAAAGVILAAAVATFAIVARRPAAGAPLTAMPATSSAAPVTAPSAPSTIALTVRTVPAGADLTIDGESVGASPYEASVPRDGKAHRVRASAAGFVSGEEVVTFDEATKIVLVLKRAVTSASPATARAAAEPKHPPAAADPDLRPSKPKRTVDEQDPYAK